MVVWPYSTSLLVMVPPVSQRPDDAEFRSIGKANGLFHRPRRLCPPAARPRGSSSGAVL